jgi:L-threonylcarbamoyladenylate synthase
MLIEEDINKAVEVLRLGGIILYPTDTIWGIGCDATNNKAVQKVLKVKNRVKELGFIILLEKDNRLNEYVEEIPEITWDLIKSFDTPTTIIYSKAKHLAKNVLAEDGSVAIRVVKDEFCRRLIGRLGKPIVSTSANFSGDPSPMMFKDITSELKKKVDYVVASNQNKLTKIKASTIIRLKPNGEFDVVRQ